MDVSEAVQRRRSVRAFLDTPVDDSLLAELLSKASRSPSGGNVQPWRIYVVNGTRTTELVRHVESRGFDETEYDIYPPGLHEPYRTNRFEVGDALYTRLGILREDKSARLAQMARNYTFFDAPAALFCFVDRALGSPQWSDLGMFLQTFMLLAQEAGLDTCAQEAWSLRAATIAEFVGAPDNEMLFCGMAIGHADEDAPVNQLESTRMPLDDWATWV